MENIIMESFFTSIGPLNLFLAILGVAIGVAFGVLPGLGPTSGLAILLPVTLYFDAAQALVFSGGVYFGAVYGGSITAILVNIPGDPTSTATIFDGYPLSQKGKALQALSASTAASTVGGIIGVLSLTLFAPLFAQLLRYFGSPEYSMLAFLGLVVIAIASRGALVKGILMGVFGMLLSSVGYDTITGFERFTFGSLYLADGIPLVAFIIGLLGVSQGLILIDEGQTIARSKELFGTLMDGIKDTFKHKRLLIQSSLIGTFLGIVPGVGGASSNFLSYLAATRTCKEPESFGTGRIEGVIAPEASNNATAAATLIPTLTFGIPGSSTAAVFLGILMLHGLNPGIMLFREQAFITYTFFWGLFLCVVVMPIIILPLLKYFARVTTVSFVFTVPTILVLCTIGTFSFRFATFDILVAYLFGIMGYFLRKCGYPLICFIMGFVLGPVVESNLARSVISYGGYSFLYERPITLSLFIVIIIMVVSASTNLKQVFLKYFGNFRASS